MTRATDLSYQGDKYLGRKYSEMDCQAFVERCLRDVGIVMDLAGSNAWYRQMTWVGTPEECKQRFGKIPVGAFLFILSNDGKEPAKYKPDGIGNASHIGLYIARDVGAIHSSQSRGGVVYSAFSGRSINGSWNRVGLWDRLDYGEDVNRLLSHHPPSEITGKATVTSTNGKGVHVRARASRVSSSQAVLPVGTEVNVVETSGDWALIEYTARGYMKKEFLKGE